MAGSGVFFAVELLPDFARVMGVKVVEDGGVLAVVLAVICRKPLLVSEGLFSSRHHRRRRQICREPPVVSLCHPTCIPLPLSFSSFYLPKRPFYFQCCLKAVNLGVKLWGIHDRFFGRKECCRRHCRHYCRQVDTKSCRILALTHNQNHCHSHE